MFMTQIRQRANPALHKLWFAGCLLLVCGGGVTFAATVTTSPPPRLTALRIEESNIKIDGVADDTFWRRAQKTGEFNRRDGDGLPFQRSEGIVAWTGSGLCVAIRCFDVGAEGLETRVTERDGPVFQDDAVELVIATEAGDAETFLHFACNVDGVQLDDRDLGAPAGWDGKWAVRTKRLEDRWEAEFYIPFSTLGNTPEVGHIWRMNILRSTVSNSELAAWSCPFGRLDDVSRFGEVVFGDESPKAYLVPAVRDIRRFNNQVSGHIANPTIETAEVTLRFRLFDSVGEQTPQERNFVAEAQLETVFDFLFDIERGGRHARCVSLIQNDAEVYRHTTIGRLAETKFNPLALIVPDPVVAVGDKLEIRAYVNLPEAEIVGHKVQVQLKKDNALVADLTEHPESRNVRFEVPTAKLLPGEYELQVDLLGGTHTDWHLTVPESARRRTVAITITVPQPEPLRVRVDVNGGIQIGEVGSFPIVVMGNGGVPADMGIAVLPIMPADAENPDALVAGALMAGSQADVPIVVTTFGTGDVRRRVAAYQYHPALFAWLIADRPFTESGENAVPADVGQLRRWHELTRGLDSKHPTIVLVGQRTGFRVASSLADVLAIVDTSGDAAVAAELITAGLAAKDDNVTVWLCQLANPANDVVIPASIRASIFAGICAGATGLIIDSEFVAPSPTSVDEEAVSMALPYLEEIKMIEPILVYGTRRETEHFTHDDLNIYATRYWHEGFEYILAANAGTKAGEIIFEIPGDLAESVLDGRKITGINGKVPLQFDPYTVYVLKLVEKKPVVTAHKITTAPEVDGALDDKSWRQAPVIAGFIQTDGGGLPAVRTKAMAAWTNDALYLGLRCHELDMNTLTAATTERDGPVWDDDCIKLFIDPNHNHHNWFELVCNTDGICFDQFKQEGGESWDAEWTVACQKFDKYWEAEIMIPFAIFGKPPQIGTVWGFNIGRDSKASDQRIEWSCTYGKTHSPNRFGDLIFGSTTASPYVTLQEATFHHGRNNLVGTLTNADTNEQNFFLAYEFLDQDGEVAAQRSPIILKPRSRARVQFAYNVRMSGYQVLNVALVDDNNAVRYRECLVHRIGER